MSPAERRINIEFALAVAFVLVFSAACAIVWTAALVPIAIGTPFALLLFWQSLHVEDFHFGQHDEDTPFEPRSVDPRAISYSDMGGARTSH